MSKGKKNIHNSGPLGMLVRSGQVKKIDMDDETLPVKLQDDSFKQSRIAGSYFKTQSGIEFNDQELAFVDPKECEPWKYANRLEDEMGDMDELVTSIQENKQLQPALVRLHPNPHGIVKYEIIFGRRRHQACLRLGVPFLVIKKDVRNIQDGIASQDAENKLRKNVSNYSNAMLYKRLLDDGVFKTEKELAEKIGMPASTLNDLMAFSKIPHEIVRTIPDIHSLSISIALKIVSLLNKQQDYYERLLYLAPQIGNTITSPDKLDKNIQQVNTVKMTIVEQAKVVKSKTGKKLFTFKISHKGLPQVVFYKDFCPNLDVDNLCHYLLQYSEDRS